MFRFERDLQLLRLLRLLLPQLLLFSLELQLLRLLRRVQASFLSAQ